ncbi:MAG TPA: hypothetical protein VKE93_08335 [Candidatus Angelobacter sp.]|nr:hypothetical protein [Candidatus Angelobacter sp.]
MSANAHWFTTMVLCASMGLFATSTQAQTGEASAGGSNGSGQTTQSPTGSAPETSSSKASAKPSDTPPQTSLGDVARKLKKNDGGQKGGQPYAGKQRVYTNDDFSPGRTGPAHVPQANASSKPRRRRNHQHQQRATVRQTS